MLRKQGKERCDRTCGEQVYPQPMETSTKQVRILCSLFNIFVSPGFLRRSLSKTRVTELWSLGSVLTSSLGYFRHSIEPLWISSSSTWMTPSGPPTSKILYLLYTRLIYCYLLRGQPTLGCNFRDTGFGDQPCLRKAKPTQSCVGWKVGSAHPRPAAQVGKLVSIFHFQKSCF